MDINDLQKRWAPTLHTSPEDTPKAVITNDEQHESVAESVEAANDEAARTGVMIAFFPTADQAQTLAIEDGEAPHELHLTLAFLGDVGTELAAEDQARLIAVVSAWAADQEPVTGSINGVGVFQTPSAVTWASVDAPALPAARQSLVDSLDKAGMPANAEHGYTPHITLLYGDARHVDPPVMVLNFDSVVIAFAGENTTIPLGGAKSAQTAEDFSVYTWTNTFNTTVTDTPATKAYAQANLIVTDRPSRSMVPEPVEPAPPDGARAFVAEINGRTLITAPATTIAAMKDPTVEDITAQHMLWMHGAFVGADAPNRNGAFWSSGDLEMAKGTVTNGPLNWLHDARHVIGTLAKADFVNPATSTSGRSGSGVQVAAGTTQPHITATAAIWKWIYPDEAYVIQQASDQEMLWYSMECISKEVSCVGEDGCGNTTTYSAYLAGAACEHVRQRASVRRFVDPVFLGGAVIVPPTRPGWAEADARVMTSANAFAEAAFEQAGQPDITTSDWEQLMTQVVRFADR